MKNPAIQVVIAIILGFLVLILSSILMIVITKNTNLFISFPVVKKTFTHTAMAVFSVLFILMVNKGNLRDYGFVWNMKFSVIKVVLISLLLGFISAIISKLLPETNSEHPAASFSIFEKILFIWIWASVAEEILTRGLIQGFLTPFKHLGIKLFNMFISLPVMVGAIFFGAMHFALLSMGMNIYLVLNIVIFGVVLGLIAGCQKEKTGSLLPAIIVHMCFNIGASLLYIINLL